MKSKLAETAVTEATKRAAPLFGSTAIRTFLDRAIDGTNQWPGAKVVANRQLENTGSVDEAVSQIIEQHLRLAGLQGFVTSLGGIVFLPVTLPANLAGLFLLQLRMSAAIAHLRGLDIDQPAVRLAALACMLGPDELEELIRVGALPGRPREIAQSRDLEVSDAEELIKQVASSLAARVAGKRVTVAVARRIPGLGGVVGGGVDAVGTYKIGKFADTELGHIPLASVARR